MQAAWKGNWVEGVQPIRERFRYLPDDEGSHVWLLRPFRSYLAKPTTIMTGIPSFGVK